MAFKDRLTHAWNAFFNKDPTNYGGYTNGGSSHRPDRLWVSRTNEKNLVMVIYNIISVYIGANIIRHVRIDDNQNFVENIDSYLNDCLTLSPNLDQTRLPFIQDVVISLFDEGCIAVVPVDTTLNPNITGSYDITSMRVGKILQWYPNSVIVRLYNEKTGLQEDVTLNKNVVAIIENPFYHIMNEYNSTLKRLVRKLNLLDTIDEQSGSGKLDLIIQLPYTIKTKIKMEQAMERKQNIETQLKDSKYGIAYIDGAEKVTQLNRPTENNLLEQVNMLTQMLYSQLGITDALINGTASEAEMLNFYMKTIDPLMTVIVDEFKKKFLTKTARAQKQSIMYFRDPFKLVPVSQLAEIADKFTRNEILTSNEVRSIVGFKPSSDPKADELRNKNLNPNSTDPNKEENQPNEQKI